MLLSCEVTLATDDKTFVKTFIQPYDPSTVAKEMSKIFVYQKEKAWMETMDDIDDLPSKYSLNQKVKAEDITRFQREVYRYTTFKNEQKFYKKICYTDWALCKTLISEQNNYVLIFLKKF